MELTQQHISLIFIVILNAVTLFVVVSETLRVPRPFLRATALAQGLAMLWHLCTVWMVFAGPSAAATTLSSLATWLFSLGFLAAVLALRGPQPWRRLAVLAGLLTGLAVVLASAEITTLATALWIGTALVLLATPAFALGSAIAGMRVALAIIQLSIAACFGVGLVLLMIGRPEMGGTLYLVNALLIPAAVQVFFQHALRLSSEEMRSSEANYRELFQSLLAAYFWLDDNGRIVTASPSFRQFGLSADSLHGQPLHQLFTEPELVQDALQQVLAEGRQTFEATIQHQDGSLRECEVACHRLDNTHTASTTGTIRDVTERNLLERQFLEAQRRESLGVLAGGVAHDFNNLLQGITSHAEFLREGNQSGTQRTGSLDAILASTATASTLCARLLQYTGKAKLVEQPLAIADTLQDLTNILQVSATGQTIQLELQDPDLVVEGDETQLRQVLLNLLQNAIDASRTGDAVTVVLRKAGADAVLADAEVLGSASVQRPCIAIDVIDTGHGMAPEQLERIFDPFYTTKEQGHGLGLSAVLGIIRRHKGIISVRSTPGQGTHVRVALPLSTQAAARPKDASPLTAPASGQVVLVVDDAHTIRDVASLALTHHGYQVLQAQDGVEVLRIFREQRSAIALVLSDINMPNLDGFGLLRAIRDISPVPFVLMSGLYNQLDQNETTDPATSFLPKPFLMKALLAEVGRALQDNCPELEPVRAAGG